MRWLELAWIAAVLAGAPRQEREWARVLPGLELAYPRDHGAHRAHRTEWWYLSGELADESGREFGFQLTIFRRGLGDAPQAEGTTPLRAREVFAGHLAIADLEGEKLVFAERLRRGGTPLASASDEDLALALEDWSLARDADGVLHARAADRASGIALELALAPSKPLVLHGQAGWSPKGGAPDNASAYVSWTRLAATGALTLGGVPRAVTGEGWYDHEFSSSALGADVAGWDWFALRLDDGRELMLFLLRDAEGRAQPSSAGTLVGVDGRARALARDDFELAVLEHWPSPRSGARYPSRWRVSIPAESLTLELRPRLADAELATAGSTGVIYWEGPVAVTGSLTGSGYAELTGYAGSMAARF